MDAKKHARQYRHLAKRMRKQANTGEAPHKSDRLRETARAFEKIAENFEGVVRDRAKEDEES